MSIPSVRPACLVFIFFFFNDTATTEIYTLSLHDALPIYCLRQRGRAAAGARYGEAEGDGCRSEEHTSELQSPVHLVCRLLLEKKRHHPQLPGPRHRARQLPGREGAPPPPLDDYRPTAVSRRRRRCGTNDGRHRHFF